MSHRFCLRVYYEDTDAGGVVYYANYLKFAERARTEALRDAGIEQTDLLAKHNIAFVVRKAEIDFIKPAKMDDHLEVETTLGEVGKVSIIMQQTISCKNEMLVKVTVKLATVDASMKLATLPEHVTSAIKQILTS